MTNDCSITETASMNNENLVDVSSLGGLGTQCRHQRQVLTQYRCQKKWEIIRNTLPDETSDEMYMEEEVVFKIHTNGYFEYDPLRLMNINGHYYTIYQKKSLDKGLKLHDVHSFFDDVVKNGSIHLYVAHKKQNLMKYYYKNMEWEEDDVGLRCYSSTPFDTRFKRKISKTKKTGVIHNEGAGRKRKKSLVNGGNKGKEKVFEDEGADKKRMKTLVNGAMLNGKAKMVEVVGAMKTGKDRCVVIGGKEEMVESE
ncbi:hypothetical protein Tco_1323125 [Tanacetum coccineum]